MSEDKYLGKQVEYPREYAPEVLVAVPREINRKDYDLIDDNLPFTGVDVWQAYELSFLTKKGFPVSGLLKLKYSCNSLYIVESKSLKLYLNSFNMEMYGNTTKEGIEIVKSIIKKDLSGLLQTDIELNIFTKEHGKTPFDFSDYTLLEDKPGINKIDFKAFKEAPELLKTEKQEPFVLKTSTNLLRSNCKVTFQPDWGSAFIYMKGNRKPDTISLLQYLVSFRNENHFHEEVCEMIYKRLFDKYQPDELAVICIYTRRGGIDITPVRVSHKHLMPEHLTNVNVLSKKLLRQ
ncbi:MAG: NADPH-dependent 7-cyano-7-deazaguanine reductase QueF [Chlorobi bacterium]|nr:NADPH-dependent 7-cyano-7-deazaguanine reductase QueF [Chlorobiota bacterium]